jgi:hypothetical protein
MEKSNSGEAPVGGGFVYDERRSVLVSGTIADSSTLFIDPSLLRGSFEREEIPAAAPTSTTSYG